VVALLSYLPCCTGRDPQYQVVTMSSGDQILRDGLNRAVKIPGASSYNEYPVQEDGNQAVILM